jgi:alkylation response protein AidB-like acyl-CoA dehydrogenase
MDRELAGDRLFFQQNTRRFLERESPLEAVRALHPGGPGFDPAWWRKGAELGWTALLANEADGGGSLSDGPVSDAVIVAEENGRMIAPGPFLPVNVVIAALSRSGTPAQRERWLPGLLDGSLVGAWAPGADVVREGSALTGSAAAVEAGDAADVVLVQVGETHALVARADLVVEPARSLDLVRRFARVRFDHSPAEEVPADPEYLMRLALTLQTAESVGAMDRAFEFTFAYLGDRHAFGRPIGSYQALKHRVADMLLVCESAKATADGAARAVDSGDPEAGRLVRVAAAYVKDAAPRFVQECVQLLGGIGVTWEHAVHLYLRRVTVNRAVLGTPEQLRDDICVRLGV